jgi:hypothetical protein
MSSGNYLWTKEELVKMISTVYTYSPIWGMATTIQTCSCGKEKRGQVQEYVTINPFNNVSYNEAHTQAKKAAQARAIVVNQKPWTCSNCRKAQSPDHQHVNADYSDLVGIKRMDGNFKTQLANMKKELQEKFSHLVGQDILIGERRAQIAEISFFQEVMIGYRFYSKSKHAISGELLSDTEWIRVDKLFKSEDAETVIWLEKCKCGSKAFISVPNYADETVTVYCEEDCGASSESFPMGEYLSGVDSAVRSWNNDEE